MGAEARETCHFLFIVCVCCRRRSNWKRGWLNHERQVEFQWCRYWISNKGGIPARRPDAVTKFCRIAIALQSIHMTIVAKAASTHNSDRRRVIRSAWMEISAQNFSIPLIRALGISAQPRASGRAQMTVTRLYELMQITSGTNEWRSNWVCTQMDRWYPHRIKDDTSKNASAKLAKDLTWLWTSARNFIKNHFKSFEKLILLKWCDAQYIFLSHCANWRIFRGIIKFSSHDCHF